MIDKNVFNGLTDREFFVLYWRCQGMTIKAIAEKWSFSEQRIQQHSSSALLKFGIPEEMHSARKARIVREEICPALYEWINAHPEKFKLLMEPLEPDEGEETYQEPIDAELVWEDEIPHGKPPIIEVKPRKRLPGQRRVPIGIINFIVSVVVLVLCLAAAGLLWQRWTNAVLPSVTPSLSFPETLETTLTPALSPTPENSPTPAISPTPVPLPIREDFSKQYSDLWNVIGNPIVTESIQNGFYSGVLTTNKGEAAKIWIGNVAWTNYVVSFRANPQVSFGQLSVGLRVRDLNNMVGIECLTNNCSWFILSDGQKETFPTKTSMWLYGLVTITVEGNTFTARGTHPPIYEDTVMSLVLPPKYEGKFPGGGVMFELVSGSTAGGSLVEIDFIEIDPFP